MERIAEYLKRQKVRIGLGLLVLAVFLADVSGLIHSEFIDRMENLAYDARVVLSMPRTVDDEIVVLDIDERSLGVEGRWPWPRDRLALMLDQLFDRYRISVLGFDVVFAEPDESSGLSVLEELAMGPLRGDVAFRDELDRLRAELNYDQRFADSMRDRPVILGYYFNKAQAGGEVTRSGALPDPVFPKDRIKDPRIFFSRAEGYGANLALFQQAAHGAGHFNPEVDSDGIIRRVPMLMEFEGGLYESLSIAMARHYLGEKGIRIGYEYALGDQETRRDPKMEWLAIGDRRIPVDEYVMALVPYRGGQGSFPYVSATDVINGAVDPEILRDKVVLVGTTAPGLLDLRSTPVQNEYAGVEIHANLISGILNQTFKEKPAFIVGTEFALLALAGLLMVFLLPALAPLWATVATLSLLLFTIVMNLLIWYQANLVIPVASGIMLILVLFLLNMSYGFFVETRGKRQLTGLFGQYVPPELVDEMSRDPEAYSLEGESREMTVLFSDVRGFTTISESLEPKDLTQMMNDFLTPMTGIIHNERGTIDKYMGDAIMAFWGAPLDDPDHARNAVRASLKLKDVLGPLNESFKAKGWPEIRIGVGINTGVMRVGNMGSQFRMAYTVMGDPVNLGSRLEGLTKEYGCVIIVSEYTRDKVPEYVYRELDRVRVKGKDEPVGIFEPIGLKDEVGKAVRDELKLYREALKLYRSQDWDMAELQFLNLQKMAPERQLYRLYAARIAHFREHPPAADWDGVFTHTTK